MRKNIRPGLASLAIATLVLTGNSNAQQQQGQSNQQSLGGVSQAINRRPDCIDFDSLITGTIPDEVFSQRGKGPILVNGFNPLLGSVNAAVIFNSANPSGGDFDLGTPNEDFGGPGIGDGGEAGSPFVNMNALSKLIIVGENLSDGNGDGRVDIPDDADVDGAILEFDFSAIGPVVVTRITQVDTETDREAPEVDFYNASNDLVSAVTLQQPGNNGVAVNSIMGAVDVTRMVIQLHGSGAIDEICFFEFVDCNENGVPDIRDIKKGNSTDINRNGIPDECEIFPGEIGDFVWCDVDNDGVQDPGEPGIGGVTVYLVCAGPDGMIGTADDFTDFQITDSDGSYLFTDVLPDICEITVDILTAPDGKEPGVCPTSVTIELSTMESFLDADFCFITPGEIGDFVWCDIDLDGVQDPGEPGIAGVIVNLVCAGPDGMIGTADDYTDSQLTDANGGYLFTGIPPSDCEVSVDLSSVPAGKVPGANCPTSFAIAVAAGQSYLDADFCFNLPPGEIGDTVYCDIDRDGVQDAGEPGIGDVIVNLTCAGIDGILGTADDITDSQMTDGNGNYLFTNVPAGLCVVEVDLNSGPDDKVPGQCPPSVQIDLAPLQSFLDADFCFQYPEPGEIGDFVWCDTNNDGIQDPREPGIAGVIVDLTCAGPDGMLGTADDYIDSQMTDAAGNYLFTDIPPGLCQVDVDENSAGIKVPGDNCPTTDGVDLQPGQSYLDADFCFVFPPGEIGDYVWCDEDDDGLQDVGEPGIGGVVVNLLCAGADGQFGTADDITDSQMTDANGGYLFTDVPAGECQVSVDISTAGNKLPGDCPTTDSVDLQPAQSYLDADFCFVSPGSIGDFVWCDLNNDGLQDVGEPGIPGVVIVLTCEGPDDVLGTADDFVASTTTDAGGGYLFTDVPPGVCMVSVDLGSVPADKLLGQCPPDLTVGLDPGQIFLDADFCFVDDPGGGEGCTPGYWKQSQHFDSWTLPYQPNFLFGRHFENAYPGKTMLQVVSQGGGGLSALGRHTMAALLNAASPSVASGLTPAEVIGMFNAVYPGTDSEYETLKDFFADLNEQGCPLN